MPIYLGEFPITPECKTYKDIPDNWALRWIEQYGGIDGAHHKQWVLDQVARILLGAPVTAVEARWEDHPPELRATVGTCPEYEAWVISMREGEDGPETYDYDEGIAP